MSQKSYWMTTCQLPRFPQLASDIDVDVCVVGGGMTGITAAYLLKKAGRTVVLLERDRCCGVDTGHTTAHLTFVTDKRLHQLVADFGRDHAQAAWDAGRAAIEQIHANVAEHSIPCAFDWVPGFLHAAWKAPAKNEEDLLRQDADLARELGFDADYLSAVPFADRPGVRFANQAKFHPLKYLAELLRHVPGSGSHVFEETEADEFQEEPLSVTAGGHKVRCKHVIIATHVPLMGKTGLVSATLMQTKIYPYSSYAVGARVPKNAVPPALFWDTTEPYYYLRVEQFAGHDYVIFGGEDHKTGQEANTKERFRRLEEILAALVPEAQEVDYRWSGQVIETNDGLPYIGFAAERQFVATGFSGNGMTFGTLAGMMAADAILERKNPWSDLFAPGRRKLKGGVWDYIKENIDYPYYYLKDRLTGAQGQSVRNLKRGEGKVLNLDGQRVAAYRDAAGHVVTRSPLCTHMGCLVNWNKAESTWDCPCHGSRFQPTGEVLAGPAERPLEEVTLPKEEQSTQRSKRKSRSPK